MGFTAFGSAASDFQYPSGFSDHCFEAVLSFFLLFFLPLLFLSLGEEVFAFSVFLLFFLADAS